MAVLAARWTKELSRPTELSSEAPAPARCRQWRGDESLGADVFWDELGVLTQAVAGALYLDDHGVVQEASRKRGGDHRVAEDLAPLGEAPVGGTTVPQGCK